MGCSYYNIEKTLQKESNSYQHTGWDSQGNHWRVTATPNSRYPKFWEARRDRDGAVLVASTLKELSQKLEEYDD